MSTLKFILASFVLLASAFVASCVFNGTRTTMQTIEESVVSPTYDIVSNWHVAAVGDPWSVENLTILEATNIVVSRKALQKVEEFDLWFDDMTKSAEKIESDAVGVILLDW